MNKETKKIIRLINNSYSVEKSIFGDMIASILFPKNTAAICYSNDDFFLLIPPQDKQKQEKLFKKIIEMLSFLNDLDKRHLIYVHPAKNDQMEEKPYIFYEMKKYVRNSQDPLSWKIGDGLILHSVEDTGFSIERNNSIILESTHLPKPIKDDLSKYLFSYIYPTTGLSEFIKRGFQSIEQRALRLSFWSLCIAVLIPIIAIFLSNRWGYITIDKKQFNQLLQNHQCSEISNSTINYPILTSKK